MLRFFVTVSVSCGRPCSSERVVLGQFEDSELEFPTASAALAWLERADAESPDRPLSDLCACVRDEAEMVSDAPWEIFADWEE